MLTDLLRRLRDAVEPVRRGRLPTPRATTTRDTDPPLERQTGVSLPRRSPVPRDDHFVDLVRAHDPKLRRLATRMLVDRSRVDDVLQEAYVRAHRALPRFREDADLGTWLHRITYNCCIDELRSAGRRPRPVEVLPDAPPSASGPGRQVAVRPRCGPRWPSSRRTSGPPCCSSTAAAWTTRRRRVLGVPRGTVASRVARARAAALPTRARPGGAG